MIFTCYEFGSLLRCTSLRGNFLFSSLFTVFIAPNLTVLNPHPTRQLLNAVQNALRIVTAPSVLFSKHMTLDQLNQSLGLLIVVRVM